MSSIAALEDILARIGVKMEELVESQREGLAASRAEADRRQAEYEKRQAEADRRRAEADRAFAESRAEFDRRMAESKAEAAKRQAEYEKRQAEADKRQAALDERIDKVCAKVGGIDENIGHHAEQFFQDTFARTLTFGGEKYDKAYPNFLCSGNNGVRVEFDVVLINGQSVAIIEVKNRIHPDFVQEMATKKIAKFRKFFPEYQKHKVYLGIAGFSFCQAVLDKAQKFGVGIIKQVGDSVEIDAGHLKAY